MTILEEFEEFLGGDIVVGNAVIGFIPNKDIFTLNTGDYGPAVGTLLDLGQCVLLRCNFTFKEYNFQQNAVDALLCCNLINRNFKWIKSVLDEGYYLELKGEALTGNDDWYNDILELLEQYLACAAFIYDECCKKYGKFEASSR